MLILYLFLVILALLIVAIFRQTTASLRSWSNIKDRWFRVGVDNQMLFNVIKPLDTQTSLSPNAEVAVSTASLPQSAAVASPPTPMLSVAIPLSPFAPSSSTETIYLRGIYADYNVALSLTSGPNPLAQARVNYPSTLQVALRAYPDKLRAAINLLLELPLNTDLNDLDLLLVNDPTLEAHLVAGVLEFRFQNQQYRLYPQLLDQLQAIRSFAARRGKFRCEAKMLLYTQPGLLFDPAPLFPILDEMVISVKLWADLGKQMLVR
jgi:hypothetical protein